MLDELLLVALGGVGLLDDLEQGLVGLDLLALVEELELDVLAVLLDQLLQVLVDYLLGLLAVPSLLGLVLLGQVATR